MYVAGEQRGCSDIHVTLNKSKWIIFDLVGGWGETKQIYFPFDLF